jgi:hypothetical protein
MSLWSVPARSTRAVIAGHPTDRNARPIFDGVVRQPARSAYGRSPSDRKINASLEIVSMTCELPFGPAMSLILRRANVPAKAALGSTKTMTCSTASAISIPMPPRRPVLGRLVPAHRTQELRLRGIARAADQLGGFTLTQQAADRGGRHERRRGALVKRLDPLQSRAGFR